MVARPQPRHGLWTRARSFRTADRPPPLHSFRRCVQRYRGHYKVQSFSCLDQYLCMAFAQLSYRESLRDIEACLRAQYSKLYHMGIRGACLARHARRCQRETRLAQLRRLRPNPDRHRPAPVGRGQLRRRSRGYRPCARRHHHRSLSTALPLGPVPAQQSCYQAPSALGSARQHPRLHTHHRRQMARFLGARRTDPRTRRRLPHGSRLYRFRPPPSPDPSRRLLLRPGAPKLPVQKALFPSHR